MSDNITAFLKAAAEGGGNAMSFPRIGDYIAGTVVDRELIDDQHQPGSQVLKIRIAVESAVIDGLALEIDHASEQIVKDVYGRGPGLREAIGRGVITAGADSIEPGDLLRIEYTGEKSTGKGRPMKIYSCEFKAAR